MLTDFDFWSKHSFSRNIQKKSYNVKPANLLIFLFIWKQSVVWPFRPAMRACRGGAWGRLVVMIWYHAQICVNHGGGAGTGVSLPAAPQPARKRTGWVIHGVGGHMSCSGLLNDLKRFTSSASPSLPPPLLLLLPPAPSSPEMLLLMLLTDCNIRHGHLLIPRRHSECFPTTFSLFKLAFRASPSSPPSSSYPVPFPCLYRPPLFCSLFLRAMAHTAAGRGSLAELGGGILPCPLLHPTLAVCYFEKGGGGGWGGCRFSQRTRAAGGGGEEGGGTDST